MNLRDFWLLPSTEQEQIRHDYPTEEETAERAFLNALFPAYETFEEADEVYDLTETNHRDLPA